MLIRALKYEPADQIADNFLRYIKGISSDKIKPEVQPFSREGFILEKQKRLQQYLADELKLDFFCSSPELTIIMVLYNKAELTLSCLESLKLSGYKSFELIIVDNNSTDTTSELLNTISGARIILNRQNLHFLKANNQALEHVRGKIVLFLNNDTELPATTLERAVTTLKKLPRCGAVGGKIVLPEGYLQEAGSIIWSDGSCLGYGRKENISQPQYNFMRVTDYCSGAFLLTHTHLFRQHGGFDSLFEPAYYEETDYCLWLQENGYSVVYDPQVVVHHFEFGSGASEKAIELHQINQQKFYRKHISQLEKHCKPDLSLTLFARFSADVRKKKRVLYIDDRVPHNDLGSGFPRSNFILNTMADLDCQVTMYPLNFPFEDSWDEAYRDINPFVEIMQGYGQERLGEFLNERKNYYDVVWISRPHNMQIVEKYIQPFRENFRIVYDAEAIFAEREILQDTLDGKKVSLEESHKAINAEVQLAKMAHVVTAVSAKDAMQFKTSGIQNVRVLGHSLTINSTNNPFNRRKGLLFVGNLDYEGSPNVDSINWFVTEIWPIIRKEIPGITFDIVGSAKAVSLTKIHEDGITVHGRVDNLYLYYNQSRLFVAPTRFAAGIPFKIHEAAAYGLPVVATQLLAGQLGWTNGNELWSSELDAELYAQSVIKAYTDEQRWMDVRRNALEYVEKEMSETAYRKVIDDILSNNIFECED